MTSYVIILWLSPLINQISDKIEKKQLERLLAILIAFFYIAPSFLYVQIMEDSGKGIVNMFIVYLIGQYIRKYANEINKLCKLLSVFFVGLGISFGVNLFLSYMKGGVGIFAPLARDNSIFTLIVAVCGFSIVKNVYFYSKIVNSIAKCVLGIYLFEGVVRECVNKVIHLELYVDSIWYISINAIYVVLIMLICISIEWIRANTLGKLEGKIYLVVSKICKYIKAKEMLLIRRM